MRNNYLYNEFKYIKFAPFYHAGDSGVTVIMAASQAVDPGSTPGCRTIVLFSKMLFSRRFCLIFFSSPVFSLYFFWDYFVRNSLILFNLYYE